MSVTGIDELATVAVHFNRMVSRLDKLQSTLEEQVTERTKQLTATNEIGRVASSILDRDELLNKVATLITEQFNYYYAAIYLLDSSEKLPHQRSKVATWFCHCHRLNENNNERNYKLMISPMT